MVGNEPVRPVSWDSTIDELLAHPVGGAALRAAMAESGGVAPEMLAMVGNFPVGRLDGIPISRAAMERVLAQVGARASAPPPE